MKAASFEYVRAHSVEEVCRLLADTERDPKLIAGGQTLVPLMAMRLAGPGVLVDINHVDALRGITLEADRVHIGAVVRQAEARASMTVRRHLPLLHDALAHVGHPPTRNRGTIGGSVATGDPAAEIPLVCAVLGATAHLRSHSGERDVAAEAFFLGPLETDIAAQECLLGVTFPRWDSDGLRVGCGFEEMAVRHGDFALVAAAAQIAVDADGRCVRAAAAVTNVAATIVMADTTVLLGRIIGQATDQVIDKATDQVIGKAAIDTVCESIRDRLEPPEDFHASAHYRRRLALGLLRRALSAAVAGALQPSGAAANANAND